MRRLTAFLALLLLAACQPAQEVAPPPVASLEGPAATPTSPTTDQAPAQTAGPTPADGDPGATPPAPAAPTAPGTSGTSGTPGAAPPAPPAATPAQPAEPDQPAASAPPAPGPPPPPDQRLVGETSDPGSDAGLEAPPYADLTTVSLYGDGEHATITVTFAGALPTSFPDGEVMGIGVDVYSDAGEDESDYQVFASGNVDGWFGYLQDANGVYDLPGELEISGSSITFRLPWFHLGSLPAGAFSAFADWSRARVALNETGADLAPDRGTAPFRR